MADNVLGSLFSDIANAIRAKTGGTETMTPATFPAKILEIETGIVPSENVILGETTLDGFVANGDLRELQTTANYSLVIGETYTVVWDSVEYTCVSQDMSALAPSAVGLGNLVLFGGTGNDEPFILGVLDGVAFYCAMDDKTSHTIKIYQPSETSGGSSEDVRYVTFMSYDGTVEYGKKAVAVGDNCADPIARGIFDTPTRESTVQYDYTFAGWATENGGSASASALSSVNEDRTVYAAYTSAVRYYTISYYDGETLLTTQQVAYGSTPSYSPTKDWYEFTGWEPDISAVTGDATYYAQWQERQGWSYVNTFPAATFTSGSSISDFAISNGKNMLAVAVGGANPQTQAYIYRITKDEISDSLCSDTFSEKFWSRCDFNYNDTKLYMNSNYNNVGYISTFTLGNTSITGVSTSKQIASTFAGNLSCSPVSAYYAYAYSSSGYKLRLSDSIDIELDESQNGFAFSPDGEHIAVCHDYTSKIVKIYSISTGKVVATTVNGEGSPKKVSYNADGSKMAVSYAEAPYVAVYDTNTYTKICDLSDVMTATGYAELVGPDTLIVGTGTSVLVYVVSDSGLEEFTHEIPVYAGTSITKVRKNHAGTQVAFLSSNGIEIWEKG